jgi:type I site-specific restriction-modification system R (restriction) subunit
MRGSDNTSPAGDSQPARSAVADKATVPIYYESHVAKLGLNRSELPKIDEEFEAIIPQSRDES